jgi:hypothetical protein
MRAYAQTGVEAIRLVGLWTPVPLAAVHQATSLPLTVLCPLPDLMHDQAFRAAHGVRVLRLGNPASAMAVKAIYDCFKHVEECVQWQQRYLRA